MRTAIVCRTNAPLVECAFDLIKRGVQVKIVGRDIAKRLKDLVGEVLEFRRLCTMEEFDVLLDGWLAEIHRKFGDKEKKEAFVAECDDYAACLKTMGIPCKDTRELLTAIDSFFIDSDDITDDPKTVTLCSGHRSKGLEWDRVIVLRMDLMPHPAAALPADLKQEEHIKYVALTRAKEQLVLCHERRP